MFYLGTHLPSWLWSGEVDVPLFVSHARLRRYRTLRPAVVPTWALDSGGFSEVHAHGARAFAGGPEPYVEAAYRYSHEIGRLAWCAPQDWMCEPWMVERTGLSIAEHQQRTVTNLLELRHLAPDLPWAPVLQGWTVDDYFACAAMYASAGVDLAIEPVVGVGSVCRRQGSDEITDLVGALAASGLNLHGFGVKTSGVAALRDLLTSADSMAWSFRARRDAADRRGRGLPASRFGCSHQSCANCSRFALWWRRQVLSAAASPVQLRLAL